MKTHLLKFFFLTLGLSLSTSAMPKEGGGGDVGSMEATYPLRQRAEIVSSGHFGTPRAGHRLHAGVDLSAAEGEQVFSMYDKGVVIESRYFYAGISAVTVRYENGFVVRYAGLANDSILAIGESVARGMSLGRIKPAYKQSASLHLEVYSGKATGDLTQQSDSQFKRRKDLIDPTTILEKADLL